MDAIHPGHELDADTAPKRVLVVSDSLGTPTHARGIFHYTANLVRALQACGHAVALLVEQSDRYGLGPRDRTRLGALSAAAAQSANLSEIYRFLSQSEFIGRLRSKHDVRRRIARLLGLPAEYETLMSAAGLRLLLRHPICLPRTLVDNDPASLGFIPAEADHLRALARFALSPAVYSLSLAGCMAGWAPPVVDAREFDLVIVDTPSYFDFRKSPGTEIVAVIHDLIPLSDPSIERRWRKIFASKIAQTLATADSFIFVSEDTRRRCEELFPGAFAEKHASVLHPTVDDRIADNVPRPAEGASRAEYLLAILSDEPRKNIDGLIGAFWHMPPGIGLKIAGFLAPARFFPGKGLGHPTRPPQVELLGYVTDTEKRRLLAGSLGVVMPSFAEGFGMPIIESLAFGKPVFCSDIPVFREVAGDDAFYFDPYSPSALAGAVTRYLDNRAQFDARAAAARARCLQRFGLAQLVTKVQRTFRRDRAITATRRVVR